MVEQLSAASQQLNPEKVRSGSIYLEKKGSEASCSWHSVWLTLHFIWSIFLLASMLVSKFAVFSSSPTTKVSNVKKKPTCCTSSHIVHHLQVGAIYFGGVWKQLFSWNFDLLGSAFLGRIWSWSSLWKPRGSRRLGIIIHDFGFCRLTTH